MTKKKKSPRPAARQATPPAANRPAAPVAPVATPDAAKETLATLIRNVGRVVTHDQLLKEVWGANYRDQTHYLRVYMGQLRHKLEKDPARPRHLTTEPGVGYRLKE